MTELIITRQDNSNKIHPCMPDKKGVRVEKGTDCRGRDRSGDELEGEGLDEKG